MRACGRRTGAKGRSPRSGERARLRAESSVVQQTSLCPRDQVHDRGWVGGINTARGAFWGRSSRSTRMFGSDSRSRPESWRRQADLGGPLLRVHVRERGEAVDVECVIRRGHRRAISAQEPVEPPIAQFVVRLRDAVARVCDDRSQLSKRDAFLLGASSNRVRLARELCSEPFSLALHVLSVAVECRRGVHHCFPEYLALRISGERAHASRRCTKREDATVLLDLQRELGVLQLVVEWGNAGRDQPSSQVCRRRYRRSRPSAVGSASLAVSSASS